MRNVNKNKKIKRRTVGGDKRFHQRYLAKERTNIPKDLKDLVRANKK